MQCVQWEKWKDTHKITNNFSASLQPQTSASSSEQERAGREEKSAKLLIIFPLFFPHKCAILHRSYFPLQFTSLEAKHFHLIVVRNHLWWWQTVHEVSAHCRRPFLTTLFGALFLWFLLFSQSETRKLSVHERVDIWASQSTSQRYELN